MLQHLRAMPRVTRSVRRHKYRFDRIIFHQFFERGIGLLRSASLGQPGASVWHQVTDRHHLDVRMILKTKGSAKLANAKSNDANLDFTIRHWLPTFRIAGAGR